MCLFKFRKIVTKTYKWQNLFVSVSSYVLGIGEWVRSVPQKIHIYHHDKYNMCATFYFRGLCLSIAEPNLVRSHKGCARCIVSLQAQVSHIQCGRIAGYTALRTGGEAAG